ncbi:MAG: hypothetical protein IKZ61_07490 [Prevotella sp.]|nr:hypothetical protein [Prevotella sp.]
MAYEPVIKETHWFGVYEYADYWNDDFDSKTINWNGNYLESIVIVKTHTGQQGNKQAPKTSFYSWLDHKLRFSVGNTGSWGLARENVNQYHQGYDGGNHYEWKGMGLCNTSGGYDFFYIHDLKAGDQISIEYYVDNPNTPTDYIFVYDTGDVTGALDGLNHGNNVTSKQAYTVSTAGDVHFNVGKGIIIRSVTITLADYQASDFKVENAGDVSSITSDYNNFLAGQGVSADDPSRQFGALGYNYSFKHAGVLEDKRGAAPYITMKFGNDNDMTFVRDLGNGVLGAASIIDASNNLDPATNNYDYLQYRLTYKEYNNTNNKYTEDEIRNTTVELIGKEWSTFTAQHDYTVDASSAGTNNSNGQLVIYGDLFDTIWPLCGNFFYFFPEVDGLLQIDYYCEGSYETPAFWYKQRADGSYPGIGDQPNVQHVGLSNGQTNGSNNYSLRVNVEKGGIYYLCSLPTNISHEHPILRVKSYTFIPRFSVTPLYKVVKNTDVNTAETQNVAEIKGGPYNDLDGTNHGYGNYTYELTGDFIRNAGSEPRVKCLGNVASAKAKVEYNNGKQTLSFYDITFKPAPANPGGAVVAHVENGVGQASFVLTIAYDAADAKWNDDKTERVAATTNGEEVKSWDFYSSKDWDLGQYGEDDGTRYATNPDGWKAKSKLFKEVHKADGLTADWEFDYVDVPNEKEPIFKSIYDMEADNADMIHETAGLVFFTEPNELGIYNENDAPSTTSFKDRFIGLMGGGKLIIPFLKENDRVVIKMGCFGNADNNDTTQPATLTFTNAKDALGTAITGDYKIGGSGVKVKNGLESEGFDDLSKPYGEYHFISTGGDFTLQVKEADLLKIYSIAIYRNAANDNADILTENSVAAEDDKRYILNVPENDAKDHAYLHINYRGEDEPTRFHQESRKTGNITADDIQPDTGAPANDEWYNYSVNSAQDPANAKFGIFKVRLGVKTIGETYVTDYAECMIPVGYRQTMEYPYTWDFTDLKKYVSAGIDEDGVEKEVDEDDFKIWDEYGFRTNSEEYDGYIFAPGGQLYGGTTMFDETRGIGIFHNDVDNKTMTMNGSADAEDGGLAVSDEFGFIVPQVAAGQAVYVHAKPVGNTQSATFAIGSGEAKSFTYAKDGIFAMQMADNATTANVTLNFKGYEINKIAVSTDAKKVNTKGWTSESRDHAIDASLTAYMTGKDIKTYLVGDPDHTNRTLKLTDIGGSEANYVLPENTGCVMFNATDENKAEILNGGFHLFVPDMHDGEKLASTSGNMMKANSVEGKVIPDSEGDLTNYVLAYKYYQLDNNGNPVGDPISGDEMFYRAANTGIKLHTNSAYLQLPTADVKPKGAAGAKYTFLFAEYDEENVGTSTAIEEIETISTDDVNDESKAQWYNLNGQKLNGKPSARGIYIKDGKKVYIK